MSKQVYDLTPADIAKDAVWVFPRYESVEDEASVRPVRNGENVPDGFQRIVRTRFRDRSGRVLPGYIYQGCGSGVAETRPVAWLDGLCISFWHGMVEPSAGYLEEIRRAGLHWPLGYETDTDDVERQRGVLDGVYH